MIIELASLVGLVVVAVIVLYTLTRFRDWVKVRIGNYRNRQITKGLGRQRLENGDYKIIQFFFDEEINKFVEKEAIQAQIIEEDLEQKFVDDVYIETSVSN